MTRATKTCFSIFPLSVFHARKGISSSTHYFESTHGGKNRGTHFTSMWLGKRQGINCGREVVLPHDPCRSPPQSPVGLGSGLGLRIGHHLGAINFAPESFCVHTCKKLFSAYMTPPSPPPRPLITRTLFCAKDRRQSRGTWPFTLLVRWKTEEMYRIKNPGFGI